MSTKEYKGKCVPLCFFAFKKKKGMGKICCPIPPSLFKNRILFYGIIVLVKNINKGGFHE